MIYFNDNITWITSSRQEIINKMRDACVEENEKGRHMSSGRYIMFPIEGFERIVKIFYEALDYKGD